MDVFDAIAKEVDDKVSQLKDHMSSGRATDYEDYKGLCGEIKGLLHIRQYVKDLQHQLEFSDE